MPVKLSDLGAACQTVLDLFVAQLETQGVQVPERRYVASSINPAWDAEQITVSVARISQGVPGAEQGGTLIGRSLYQAVQFAIILLRPTSVVQDGQNGYVIPSDDALTADGVQNADDAGQLWAAAGAIHSSQALARGNEPFMIGPLEPVATDGGLAGVRMLLTLGGK